MLNLSKGAVAILLGDMPVTAKKQGFQPQLRPVTKLPEHYAGGGELQELSAKSGPLDSQAQVPTVNTLPPGKLWIGGEKLPDIYDWSRPYAHHLAQLGLINAVLLKPPGSKRGRKLYEIASIDAFLQASRVRPTKTLNWDVKAVAQKTRGRPRKLGPEEVQPTAAMLRAIKRGEKRRRAQRRRKVPVA